MSKRRTKRQQAIIRRRIFLVLCAVTLVAVIAAIYGIISIFTGGGEESEKAKKPESSQSEETESKTEPVSSVPELVSRGEYTLDANYTRLFLVNSEVPLPADYNYEGNLADLESKYRSAGSKIDAGIRPYLYAMIEAAWADGVKLSVCSPYRDYNLQNTYFENYCSMYMKSGMTRAQAEAETLKSIARPGTSEHHTGLCADFNVADDSFEKTPMYPWLKEHAAEYGFIERYPADKTEITKIIHESWHWRFVGIKEAEKINKSGLCLEEYVKKNKIDNAAELLKK